ncbi:MAG: aa3-type cytochrome c oxidase subunit IV [Alphaproteobacteria bacterium]|nr:aa3-type cytochrome c oxidase subunit IV [Alphaproteobacteria bacterium]
MADMDDLKAHEEMWRNFVKLMACTAVATVACLSLLALILL